MDYNPCGRHRWIENSFASDAAQRAIANDNK
jgi:hypothetical protein